MPHRTTGTKAQCLLEERETMDSYFVNLNVRVYICEENFQTADPPSPPICEFPHSFMIKKHSHFIRKLWGGFGSDPSAICASCNSFCKSAIFTQIQGIKHKTFTETEMEKRADDADASVLFFLLGCANFLAVYAQIR